MSSFTKEIQTEQTTSLLSESVNFCKRNERDFFFIATKSADDQDPNDNLTREPHTAVAIENGKCYIYNTSENKVGFIRNGVNYKVSSSVTTINLRTNDYVYICCNVADDVDNNLFSALIRNNFTSVDDLYCVGAHCVVHSSSLADIAKTTFSDLYHDNTKLELTSFVYDELF